MARKRTIDTDGLYFDNELTRNLSSFEILAYIRLWGIAEDWGGFEYKPQDIKLQMGGIKISAPQISDFLDKMVAMGKIILFEKEGEKIGWIKNFLKHQDLTNPSLPKLPLPEWIKYEKKQYPGGKSYAVYEVIESKIPVDYQYATSTREKKGKEKKGKEIYIDESKDSPFFSPIRKYFVDSYREKFGQEPSIDFGKDGRTVNSKRNLFQSIDQAYELVKDFLDSRKAEECGYTLSVCFSSHTINLWRAKKLLNLNEDQLFEKHARENKSK